MLQKDRVGASGLPGPGFWAGSPLLCVEDGEDVLVGHEALLHVTDFEVVQRQHVLLLFLLREEGEGSALAGFYHQDHGQQPTPLMWLALPR